MKNTIIDTDIQPKIPYSGWTIESHKKMGKIEWNPEKVELYLSEKQKSGYIIGNDLRKEIENMPVLNATVMDYLLAHPNLIPDSWKNKYVYFWGTIFRDADGYVYVEYLYRDDAGWYRDYDNLDDDWLVYEPAARLAQPSDTRKVSSTDLDFLTLSTRVSDLEKRMDKLKEI